jgi:hypothetical protein
LNLGLVAFAQGDWEAARAFFAESLTICSKLGLQGNSASCLEGLAGVHGVGGEPKRAARLLGAAEAVRTAINEPMPPGDRAEYERFVAAARAALDEKTFAAAWAEGRAMPLEQAIELALADQLPGAKEGTRDAVQHA